MKSEKNILIAFILNFAFSVFEFFGGIYTGSVAILSDAVHDIGDAVSIAISFFLEKKSKKKPNDNYTYGYARYSLLGSVITTVVLLLGSAMVIFKSIGRLISPAEINYSGMLVFAAIGVCVNFCAAFFTRHGSSHNQRAVNLHMLEDVLGWLLVLVGALVMKFTDFTFIDPIMSICVAVFILINAIKNLKEVIDIFLEKTPHSIDINEIKEHVKNIDEVTDVHHIHVWTIDGEQSFATMHIVTDGESHTVKDAIRKELMEHGISHVTLELETKEEHCHEKTCNITPSQNAGHHHHHH